MSLIQFLHLFMTGTQSPHGGSYYKLLLGQPADEEIPFAILPLYCCWGPHRAGCWVAADLPHRFHSAAGWTMARWFTPAEVEDLVESLDKVHLGRWSPYSFQTASLSARFPKFSTFEPSIWLPLTWLLENGRLLICQVQNGSLLVSCWNHSMTILFLEELRWWIGQKTMRN